MFSFPAISEIRTMGRPTSPAIPRSINARNAYSPRLVSRMAESLRIGWTKTISFRAVALRAIGGAGLTSQAEIGGVKLTWARAPGCAWRHGGKEPFLSFPERRFTTGT